MSTRGTWAAEYEKRCPWTKRCEGASIVGSYMHDRYGYKYHEGPAESLSNGQFCVWASPDHRLIYVAARDIGSRAEYSFPYEPGDYTGRSVDDARYAAKWVNAVVKGLPRPTLNQPALCECKQPNWFVRMWRKIFK